MFASKRTTSAAVAASVLAATATLAAANGYRQTNLVANRAEYNPTALVDPYLVNPWGIALRPPGAGGHIWSSNEATGTTTTYIGDANGVPLYQDGLKVVPIATTPADMDLDRTRSDGNANVTGQVYNAASDVAGQPVEFFVSGDAVNYNNDAPAGVSSGAAKFVFVTLDGSINAWREKTNPGMLEAVVVKDFSTVPPLEQGLRVTPTFTGVGMTTDAFKLDTGGNAVADNRLYVSDFGNGRVQVFDNAWNEITTPQMFQRPAGLGANYSPFNVQVLEDGRVYVVWAETAFEIDDPGEEVPGAGFGRVVAYDRDGTILQDFTDHANLNAPWGIALAPDDFGAYGGALLVANFGDGTIAAYDPKTTASLGYLKDRDGKVISIDGIWGLTFGNGVSLGDRNALYFTAGPNEERDGILGSLRMITPGDTNDDGTVNFDDLLTLAQHYGGPGSGFAAGDFDDDGLVNFDDLLTLAQRYGQPLSAAQAASVAPAFAADWQRALATVPEPTALVLLAAAPLAARRRRG